MVATCTDHLLSNELPPDEVLAKQFAWFNRPTQSGLAEAGQEYLRHLLSEEQVALYRVVTRDADRFPELGSITRRMSPGQDGHPDRVSEGDGTEEILGQTKCKTGCCIL